MRMLTAFRSIGFVLAACACAAPAADKPPGSLFLVARHDMPDVNFHDAVVVVTGQAGGGPVGLIVNKPTTIPLSRVFPDVEKLRSRADMLFFGGPVQRQQLFIVVRAAKPPDEDAVELMEGVYMSANGETMRAIVAAGAAPDRFRVFAGYAGWAPAQLEGEVSRGDWHLAKPDAQAIFSPKPEAVWRELFRRASAVQARYPELRQRYQPTRLSAMKIVAMSMKSPSFEWRVSCGSWSKAIASTSSGSAPILVTLPLSVSMETSSRLARPSFDVFTAKSAPPGAMLSAFTALMMEASMSASPPTTAPVAGSTSSRIPFDTRAATIASPWGLMASPAVRLGGMSVLPSGFTLPVARSITPRRPVLRSQV
jgi:putative transcriptional regulator